MNQQLTAQELGHRVWSIVRLFYKSLVDFREQHDAYEEKVLAYARAAGLNRADLRLKSSQLAELLDFKGLERLRDRYIHELKDLCHFIFRSQDHTDLLDRYVSDIFHEISILKEEHYTVKTYAPMYEQDKEEVELRYILDEAHAMFPLKLRQIHYLFGKATERMEQHLPSFRPMPIVIRSLYLHRDDFIRAAYPDGLNDFYDRMYAWGPVEGYYHVGLSFYHAGFFSHALDAFGLAEAAYKELLAARRTPPQQGSPHVPAAKGDVKELRSIVRSLRTKLRRLEKREPSVGDDEAADPSDGEG